MKIGYYAAAAIIAACVASASAQTASQTSQPGTNANAAASSSTAEYGPAMSSDASLNPGTLAESAGTTALTTSSYHQGDGLFSWFSHKQ